MLKGWFSVALVLLIGCKAAREYAEKRYDERRAAEAQEDAAAREEAARPPTPMPNGPGLAPGTYRVSAARVEVFRTTSANKAWDLAPDGDPAAAPDLGVRVRVDGKTVGDCKLGEDRYEDRCTFDADDAELELTDDTTLELAVIERDSLLDDPVGTAKLPGRPAAWGTGMELQLEPQQRVKFAWVTLERVPTWWEKHGTTVLLFGGLFVVVTGGLIWLSSQYEKRKQKRAAANAGQRCVTCGARLANYAKCSDCGAEQAS